MERTDREADRETDRQTDIIQTNMFYSKIYILNFAVVFVLEKLVTPFIKSSPKLSLDTVQD